jgi:hypothetical protein
MGTWAAPFANMRPKGNLGLYAVLACPSEGESMASKLLAVIPYCVRVSIEGNWQRNSLMSPKVGVA